MFLFREDPAMRKAGLHWALIGMAVLSAQTLFAAKPLNILLITADDMNRNSVGIFDSQVPDATPNIDQLAATSRRFARASCHQAVCGPSRNSILTGRLPDNTRVWHNRHLFRDTLPEVMGYSARMRNHRYTRWVRWPSRDLFAEEFYDYTPSRSAVRQDGIFVERENVIDDPAYGKLR